VLVADRVPAVVVVMPQHCRRPIPASIRISPDSHPGPHPGGHRGQPSHGPGEGWRLDVRLSFWHQQLGALRTLERW